VSGDDDDAKKKAEDAEQRNRTMMDATKEKVNDTLLKTQEMAGETKEKMAETLCGARATGEQSYTDARSCAEQKAKEGREQLADMIARVEGY